MECEHTDVRRQKVLIEGERHILCPACAENWSRPSVGPAPRGFDPPQVDDLALAAEYAHLRDVRLHYEYCIAELDAARRLLADETQRIRKRFKVTFRDISEQLGMSAMAMELFCKYEPGKGYMFKPRKQELKRQARNEYLRAQYRKRKTPTTPKANTDVYSSHGAQPIQPPD